MKRRAFLAAAAASLLAAESRCLAEPGADECDVGSSYVGVAASMALPQGGSRMSRRSGASVRVGRYVTDLLAVEGEASWMEDRAGLAARALWHWWGYERLDPFFTFGAKGWMPRGMVGPFAGVGTFYHIDDNLSLRAEGEWAGAVDDGMAGVFTLAAGLQYSF